MNLGTVCADITLPGFQGPTMEIPTPPSDHTPLKAALCFWGRVHSSSLAGAPDDGTVLTLLLLCTPALAHDLEAGPLLKLAILANVIPSART
jgi:hypothetical protein